VSSNIPSSHKGNVVLKDVNLQSNSSDKTEFNQQFDVSIYIVLISKKCFTLNP